LAAVSCFDLDDRFVDEHELKDTRVCD
jgi:hypothetical protein